MQKPMKDYVIDYTWRVNGKEIVNCPVCRKQGVLRKQLDGSHFVVHKESPRLEDQEYYQQFCSPTEQQVTTVLHRKELDRIHSLEHYRRNKRKEPKDR